MISHAFWISTVRCRSLLTSSRPILRIAMLFESQLIHSVLSQDLYGIRAAQCQSGKWQKPKAFCSEQLHATLSLLTWQSQQLHATLSLLDVAITLARHCAGCVSPLLYILLPDCCLCSPCSCIWLWNRHFVGRVWRVAGVCRV
jgi:hypothetical protein